MTALAIVFFSTSATAQSTSGGGIQGTMLLTGPGTVARALARRVGRIGRVLGCERSEPEGCR